MAILYAIVSFDFSKSSLKEDFKDLLHQCGAVHEKNGLTFGLKESFLFDPMIDAIKEWKESQEFDYVDYVRVYYPQSKAIVIDDLI